MTSKAVTFNIIINVKVPKSLSRAEKALLIVEPFLTSGYDIDSSFFAKGSTCLNSFRPVVRLTQDGRQSVNLNQLFFDIYTISGYISIFCKFFPCFCDI